VVCCHDTRVHITGSVVNGAYLKQIWTDIFVMRAYLICETRGQVGSFGFRDATAPCKVGVGLDSVFDQVSYPFQNYLLCFCSQAL